MDDMHLFWNHITNVKALKINDVDITAAISETQANIIYVSKSGSDETGNGSFGSPFGSINHANNYAIQNVPVWNEKVVVKVLPGIYTEHIENAHYRVLIMGEIDPTEKPSAVTIRNTGADPDHYILGMTGKIHMIGCNLVTTDEDNEPIVGVYGKIQQASTFSYCNFENGYFIEQNEIAIGSIYQAMHQCYFLGGGDSFVLTGNVDAHHYLNFSNCSLDDSTNMRFSSTCTCGETNTIKFDNCGITSSINVDGNWNTLMINTEMGGDAKLTFDTDGYVDIFVSTISGGIHFYSDTPLTKRVVNCIFKNTPAGEGDITADASIEFIEYSGNHQYNGIDGEVITVSKIKNVGGGQNKYRNIHEALKGSILTDTIINLEGDVDIDEPLVINPGIDVQIDGNKKWKLNTTHATTLVDLGLNQQLSFVNMKQISGGKLAIVNGNGATLSFVSCGRYTEPNNVNIQINGGDISSLVYIVKTTIIGIGAPPIIVNDIEPWLIIDRSFIKGAAGEPSIEWLVDADSRCRCKYSTFLHGSGGTNSPFINTDSGDVTLSIYNCALNAVFPPADFTNNIGSPNNTTDPQIDY